MMARFFPRIQSILFLLFLPCCCSGHLAAPLLRFSTFLDPSNKVYLRWNHDEQEMMTFELQTHPTGWAAFGFSPRGELPGSDIVIGGVFPNGSIYFSGCHVENEGSVEEDESQNYQLLSVTENGTSTTMVFKQHLRTCDPQDLHITSGLSIMNEICLTFLFYHPCNNISSCMGYPDILHFAHVLKQEASDALEGITTVDFVDWDDDTVKIAEKAATEADQVVMIKNTDEFQRNESDLIRDISNPEPVVIFLDTSPCQF